MKTAELPKQYDPKDAQNRYYELWVKNGYFHADPTSPKPPYCIVIPPPNVTGALHMGHALNNTIQDILIRWRRMQNHEVLWMPGTDHAGIATQAVVERRLLEEEKKTRHDLGRAALVERIWVWKDEYEKRILNQLRLMGCSCDWDRTRFTLDELCSRAVRRTFFNLFKAGKIFRGKRLVNWDSQLRTAVADDEIYYEEVAGHLWTIRYPIAGSTSGEVLHIATTRPETMLGDTAVAVHPDDERYKHLIGKSVNLPLTDRQIPIIADALLVDPAFGTGVVKVTPAHDPNDYQAGLRNGLPMINLLNPDGTYNENAGKYAGIDRLRVRKRVVEDLKALDLLERVDSYLVRLNHSDRSKTPIEPYLSDQWFVRMGDDPAGGPGFAQLAMDAVTSERMAIHPERYAKSYLDWLGEKRDWCISRQLWWGHRIPIWYCETCTEGDLRTAFAGRADVTWSPAENGGWLVCAETDLARRRPGHAPHARAGPRRARHVVQLGALAALDARLARRDARASEVLSDERAVDGPRHHHALGGPHGRFSACSTGVMCRFVTSISTRSFRTARASGCRSRPATGSTRSTSSKSTAPTPCATRWPSGATETQDLRIPVEPLKLPDGRMVNTSERFELGRNFANKFWNAARLVLMNLEDYEPAPLRREDLSIEDRWIIDGLDRTIGGLTAALEQVSVCRRRRGSCATLSGATFATGISSSSKAGSATPPARPVAQRVLAAVLDQLCRLLHPIMPFVTEQVWQGLAERAWPRVEFPNQNAPRKASASPPGRSLWAGTMKTARKTVDQWCEAIKAIRNLKAERNLPKEAKIAPIIVAQGQVAESLRQGEAFLRGLLPAESVTIVAADRAPEPNAPSRSCPKWKSSCLSRV